MGRTRTSLPATRFIFSTPPSDLLYCAVDRRCRRLTHQTHGLGGFQRVEQNCCRIRSLFLLNQRHSSALGPDCQLIGSSSTKGIGCTDQNVVALGFDSLREFANRRRLPHTVHAYDHHHVRQNVFRRVCFRSDSLVLRRSQDSQQLCLNSLLQRLEIADLLAGNSRLTVSRICCVVTTPMSAAISASSSSSSRFSSIVF